MAARAHPRSLCNRNTKLFNFTTNRNTNPKLKKEIDQAHHGLGGSRRMKIIRISLSVVFAFCLTRFCPSLIAEEIKYSSPDGRFALGISEDLKIDLIETSGKILVDLGKLYVEPETSLREETILVWSADSKWAAYGTRGPGYRSGDTTVYYWNGVAFEEVRLPANLPEPKIDTGEVKLKGYAVQPLRWLKPGNWSCLMN